MRLGGFDNLQRILYAWKTGCRNVDGTLDGIFCSTTNAIADPSRNDAQPTKMVLLLLILLMLLRLLYRVVVLSVAIKLVLVVDRVMAPFSQ